MHTKTTGVYRSPIIPGLYINFGSLRFGLYVSLGLVTLLLPVFSFFLSKFILPFIPAPHSWLMASEVCVLPYVYFLVFLIKLYCSVQIVCLLLMVLTVLFLARALELTGVSIRFLAEDVFAFIADFRLLDLGFFAKRDVSVDSGILNSHNDVDLSSSTDFEDLLVFALDALELVWQDVNLFTEVCGDNLLAVGSSVVSAALMWTAKRCFTSKRFKRQ